MRPAPWPRARAPPRPGRSWPPSCRRRSGRAWSPRAECATARLVAHLGQDALQARLGLVVDVGHRRRHGGVDVSDEPVLLARHRAVARMALAPGPQLDELPRLAGVEVEHVADAIAQAQRVERLALAARVGELLPGRARDVQRT